MDAIAVLKEAFEVQEEIARERKALREKEALLQNLLWQLENENVGRLGYYERKRKVVSRDVIISERFRARWPELFTSLAKVTLKDAREANIPEAELMEACDSTEQVSWKIIFLGNGTGRA
jgi:hypothetical protein